MVKVIEQPRPELRIIDSTDGETWPYYILQRWRTCDCPDCTVEGHWMWESGGHNLEHIQHASERFQYK